MQADTLPKLLLGNGRRYGKKRSALREKEFGIWQSVSWDRYVEAVKEFALGLYKLGFRRGDKLAIIGDNRPEWIYAELAVQSLGGISIGLYQDSQSKEVSYILNHSEAMFVVVEDQEQVDKILEIREEVPNIRKVIYYDPRGLRNYSEDILLSFPDVQEIGHEYAGKNSAFFEREVGKGQGADVAIICYTSGTTGFPKGAMLTHDNLINMAANLTGVDPINEKDEFVSFLPLAWIGEQMTGVAASLMRGFTVNFPEEPETVNDNIREIGPHVMFSPPRIWEDIVSRIQVQIEDSSWLKKKLYHFFMPLGYRVADCRFNKEPVPLWLRFMHGLGEFMVFSAIKDHFGLLRLHRGYTGGAALGPQVFRFYHALGVNLKQIYGQTEVSGIAVVHHDGDVKYHSVGRPIPGTEVKISAEGEIQIKSSSVFTGYYNNEDATKEALTDGWLHTGDAGYIDDNDHLVVIDRVKYVLTTKEGEIFSPQYIENSLKFSMYIKEAVVIGKDRPYVVGIINIDFSNTGKWAENNQLTYTTYTDLTQKEEVLELVSKEVIRVNEELPPAARIRKFVLLHKEFDADDEELTRTKKIRRGYVEEKYAVLIDALYGGDDTIKVKDKVKYRDGRQTVVETALAVILMDMEVA
ncbi:AMP-binding protein [Metallumcola ferriviriculae]|uniref:Acyl-CoA synthetase n=1 Tax=Metallumcola ferriviriculae TaxID=3039180 RepID=A0AAU0UPY7_9FIRM|nr:AMP-binding protein [Desulfitibacteraceae bacterium MK1]